MPGAWKLKLPRVMITAPASGSGKTLITCGILQALVNRGIRTASFKCGPDYIDPMFHSRVIGMPSKNLDPYFTDEKLMRYLFARSAEKVEMSVIEGVMGFYDGIGSVVLEGSTYDVSQRLKCPVILVVNCKGASLSVVPVVKGFKEYTENNIKGVILNNMSPVIFKEISKKIEEELGIAVIGYVPNVSELVLESRHLGLVLPGEIDDLKGKLNQLADVLEKTLDIDRLLDIAGEVPELEYTAPKVKKLDSNLRIGLAADEAFCFTYEDNISLLEECGAEIVRFSPIYDQKLPDGIHGLILSGGYPEMHAEALSSNKSMLKDIRDKIENGLPCMAECGGFMYLNNEVEDSEGKFWKMVGVIDAKVSNKGRLSRFGYIEIHPKGRSKILPAGCVVRGHEFHYWDSEDCGEDCEAVKSSNGRKYDCIHCSGNLVAGFPHIYYYSNPDIAYYFLKFCSEYEPI